MKGEPYSSSFEWLLYLAFICYDSAIQLLQLAAFFFFLFELHNYKCYRTQILSVAQFLSSVLLIGNVTF